MIGADGGRFFRGSGFGVRGLRGDLDLETGACCSRSHGIVCAGARRWDDAIRGHGVGTDRMGG